MTTQINVRIDENLKKETDAIFDQLGISMADAFRIFLKKVKMEKGIPFDMKVDNRINWNDLNEETKQAIKEIDANIDKLPKYNSTEELFESMGITNYK